MKKAAVLDFASKLPDEASIDEIIKDTLRLELVKGTCHRQIFCKVLNQFD